MLSSLLHNTVHSTMLDRLQTQGAKMIDNYRRFRWNSNNLMDEMSSSRVDIIKMHTEDLEQEWAMGIESFIIMDDRNENTSYFAPAAATRDDCAEPPQAACEPENTNYEIERENTKQRKGVVLQEMKERRERQKEWTNVLKEFCEEVSRRRRRRRRTLRKNKKTATKQPSLKKTTDENPILARLEEYYRKFDMVIADLEDRQELIEIEEFKQLVIQDLCDRFEALREHKRRLPSVTQELMQKVVIHDLKHEGLLPNAPKATKTLLCDEWIELADEEPIADDIDWIVCDDAI